MQRRSNLFGGNTNFKTSLAISAIVLACLLVFIISQILKLQSSGNEIVINLQETKKINTLLSNLILIEEKFEDKNLDIQFLDSIKTENNQILKQLKNKKTELSNYISNQSEFYKLMEYNLFNPDSLNSSLKMPLAKRTKEIKKELLYWYSKEVDASTKKFDRDNSLFTTIFIASTIIGFVILGLSILKIIEARATINEKSKILDSILENTNDIANFYEPIFNSKNEVKDFKITYASKTNLSLTDLPYNSIVGKRLSEAYPFMAIPSLFNQLVSAYENQQYFEKTIEVPVDDKIRYFKARYVPVKGGLQIMITELTSLYTKQEELETTNSDLALTNQLFHEAEEVADLASFVWYLHRDYSMMSDNIYRILGHKPQSFDMSAARFREFTHPDDLKFYDQEIDNAVKHNKPIDFTFRVITKDNITKHLYAKGHYSERNDESIMVGVVHDVTERIKNETTLEAQNLELKRQNTELDSFNRVASHDLQEPLRKIQMFISRVNDESENYFTEKSQSYFNKIESAATRMRDLINNLLAFSRIDNKDYKFETVDTKEIFENVLDTFSESIGDTTINLNQDNLPTLTCIPFLLEQLFTNIIGNAIKYKSKDRKTKITITCNKISKSEVLENFDKKYNIYFVFNITDNGIGFNQADGEKIFKLFQRLHSKSDYAGTGLGLAICEKIVAKHNGYISAKGVKNKGATFTIYLPKKP